MSRQPEGLTATQAAERAGISKHTWRSYRSRLPPRGNPVPAPDGRDPETGTMVWWPSTVHAGIARRTGRGARTDLTKAN
jgi:hypothetical protein